MDTEAECIKALLKGDVYDGGEAKSKIHGETLRQLVLRSTQLPRTATDAQPCLPQTGIRLRNVVILDGLDFSDCSADDIASELTLDLEDCIIHPLKSFRRSDPASDEPTPCLLARHACFSRLRLHKCRFSMIDIRGSDISGDLEVTECREFQRDDLGLDTGSGAKPDNEGKAAPEPPTGCRMEASMVEVHGMVRLRESRFSLARKVEGQPEGKKEQSSQRPDGTWDYALGLSEVRIGGSLMMQQEVEVEGGINLTNADIKGDIWAEGLQVTASGSGRALMLQGSKVGGFAIFRTREKKDAPDRPFTAKGSISLLNARLGGLYLIPGEVHAEKENGSAVVGMNLTVSGRAVIHGPQGAKGKLTGSLYLHGARFEADLVIQDLLIDHDLQMSTVNVLGNTLISNVHVKNCIADDLSSSANMEIVSLRASEELRLNRARLEGDLRIAATTLRKALRMRNAKINGDVIIGAECRFHGESSPVDAIALEADNLEVHGDVTLVPRCHGDVGLAGAQIGGDLRIGDADGTAICLSPRSTLNLGNAKVGRALRVSNSIRVEALPSFSSMTSVPNESAVASTVDTKTASSASKAPAAFGDFPFPRETRAIDLSFYPDARLVEMLTSDVKGDLVLAAVVRIDALLPLNGTSPPIHEYNAKHPPDLGSAEKAADYLRFFCAFTWGDEGPFRIVERPEDIEEGPAREAAKSHLSDLKVEKVAESSSFRANAVVSYAHNLFRAVFQIGPTGTVEMLEDQEIAKLPGEDAVQYTRPFRRARDRSRIGWLDVPLTLAGRTWGPAKGEELKNLGHLFKTRQEPADESVDEPVDHSDIEPKLRIKPLSFYPNRRLHEIQRPGPARIESYLVKSRFLKASEITRLDGTSPPIHALNARGALQLQTPEQVKDSLQFFCAHVWGEAGAFRLIENEEGLPAHWRRELNESKISIGKIQIRKEGAEDYGASAFVLYSNALFKANFRIRPNGMVEMLNDEPVKANLPKPLDVFYRDKSRRQGKAAPEKADGWLLAPAIPGDWQERPPRNLLKELARNDIAERRSGVAQTSDAIIDLSGAAVGVLEDDSGSRWPQGDFTLKLGGLSYEQLSEAHGGQRAQHSDSSPTDDKDPKTDWNKVSLSEVRSIHQRLTEARSSCADWSKADREEAQRILTVLSRTPEEFKEAGLERDKRSADRLLKKATKSLKRRRRDSRWRSRHAWLVQQYGPSRKPSFNNWNAQPFVRAVNSLNAMGDHYGANRLNAKRLTYERQIERQAPERWRQIGAWIAQPFRWLYGFCFDHGQSPASAIVTFVSCIVIGCFGASLMAYGSQATLWPGGALWPGGPAWAAGPPLEGMGSGKGALFSMAPVLEVEIQAVDNVETAGGAFAELRSGSASICDNIQPWIFALDVFLPLVDLHQESQCAIPADRPGWRWAKALYALLGWIISSLTILTVTGVLRRYPER
jgi:hypothetical protein